MSSAAITTVKELKESLSKQLLEKDVNTDRCLDILKRLDECPITLQILSETLVGAVVSKCKANTESVELAALAKALVKKWKNLAKESGVASSSKRISLERAMSSTSVTSAPPATTARVASTKASAAHEEEAEADWAYLPPLRKNICSKLHQVLLLSRPSLLRSSGLNANAVVSLTVSRSSEIEQAIQSLCRGEKIAYTEKARSLVFNLKKNSNLRENILLGHTQASQLVQMTPDQLVSEDKAKERAELVEHLQDSRRLDWEQANEHKINEMCGIRGDLLKASLFTCGRCKSIKTTSTQKQTRSADEPMTVFVFCLNCGNRWKC